MIQLVSSFFLVNFLSHLCSIGAIVGSSFHSKGITLTCQIVMFQTLGSALGALLMHTKSKKLKLLTSHPTILSISAVICSALIAWTPNFLLSSLLLVLIRTTISTMLTAVLLAVKTHPPIQSDKLVRTMQVANISSLLASLAIGPIIAGIFGIRELFAVDAVLGFLIFILLLNQKDVFKNQNTTAGTNLSTNSNVDSSMGFTENFGFYTILVSTFLVWFSAGSFHVLEVPILTSRFNLSPSYISSVFLLAGAANLITVKFISIPSKIFGRLQSLVISGIIMVSAAYIYLRAQDLVTAMLAVVFLGGSNGFFSLNQISLIQLQNDTPVRIRNFLYVRFVSNFGLLVAAATSNIIIDDINNLNTFSVLVLCALFAMILLAIYLIKFKESKLVPICTAVLAGYFFSFEKVTAQPDNIALKIAVREIPKILAPHLANDVNSALIANQVFETLYIYSDDNSLMPLIAESHSISPDGKNIQIRIRRDKTFSDGTPITSKEVVDSLLRAIKLLGPSIGWALEDLKGFQEYSTGKTSDLAGLVADNPWSISLALTKQNPRILQVLTVQTFGITLPTKTGWLGSGPYVLEKINSTKVKLRGKVSKSDNRFNQIEFILSKNKYQDHSLIKSESIDIVGDDVTNQNPPQGFTRSDGIILQTLVLTLNKNLEKFNSAQKRCAFAKQVQKYSLSSNYRWQDMANGMPFFRDVFSTTQKEQGIFPSSVTINVTDSAAKFDDKINRNIGESISKGGYKVTFKRSPNIKLFVDDVTNGRYEAAIFGFLLDYADPDALFYPLLATKQQYNFTGYSNAGIDALLRLGRKISDKELRQTIYSEVVQQLYSSCEITFIGVDRYRVLYNQKILMPKISNLGFHRVNLALVRKNYESQPSEK